MSEEITLKSLVGTPLEQVEKLFIIETLIVTDCREEAAKLLGISERSLYRKIKEYGLINSYIKRNGTKKFKTLTTMVNQGGNNAQET